MSLDDLLRRLVMEDEQVLTAPDKQVKFTKLTVFDAHEKEIRSLPAGRALITNKRILFISSGVQQSKEGNAYSMYTWSVNHPSCLFSLRHLA